MNRSFPMLLLLMIVEPHFAHGQAPNSSQSTQGGVAMCESEIAIEYGKRRPVIDGMGWCLGIPSKLLYWDSRVDNHCVGEGTVERVAEYLADRKLTDVKVRVNRYDPWDEWQRTMHNKRIGAGWRYTFGTLSCIRYTCLPGRLFGEDEYNPYSNTVNLYSDVATIGIAESAYAFDVHQRRHPGTYAAVQSLPLVGMWHETIATDETLSYSFGKEEVQDLPAARRTLYVRYGIESGGEVARLVPQGSVIFPTIGALYGHLRASREDRAN